MDRTGCLMIVTLAVFALTFKATADTYVWTGQSSANESGVGRWMDVANWTMNDAPAITPPGCYTAEGGSVTNGVKDDVVVFGPVASGAATTIDLDGLVAVGGVRIVGADAPAYTFGTSSSQLLRLDTPSGNLTDWRNATSSTGRGSFIVSAEVTRSPVILAGCAVGYGLKHTATTAYGWGGLVNNAAVPLEINNFGYAYSADTTSGTKQPYVQFIFAGSGKINVNGVFTTTTTCYPTHLENSDVTYKKSTSISRLFTDGPFGPSSLRLIEIPAGVELSHTGTGFGSIHCARAVRIYGEGTLVFKASAYLEEYGDMTDYRQIDCHVRVTGSAISTDQRVLMMYALGDYYYNCPSNDFPAGRLLLYEVNNSMNRRLLLGAPRFGRKTDDGNRPLGLINGVVTYGVGGIRFTGDVPDTTDIDLIIGELTTVSSSYTWKHPQCEYVVAESGTAAFTVESDLIHGYVPDAAGSAKAYCGTNTLHLTGDGTGGGIFNRVLADGETTAWSTTAVASKPVTLALRKTGAGAWTLPKANTFTGETTLEEGTLDLGETGTLANSTLVFKGGTLAIADGRTVAVPSIRTAGGNSRILLGAGATLVVAVYNDAGTGKLDVIPGEGARFVNTAAVGGSSTTPLTTLKCNGGDVFFDGEGKLTGSCGELTTTIPVKGGVVPNDSTARVGIVDGGVEGPVTLATPETVVTALTYVASADGVVDMNGQTLRVGQVNVGGTAGNLTIGGENDVGLMKPFPDDPDKRIDFTVDNPRATVTVDAKIDGDTARIYKYGSGKVVLNNAADMSNIIYGYGGELAFVTNIPGRPFTLSLQKSGCLSFLGDPADRKAFSLLDATVRAGNGDADEAVLRIENVAGGYLRYDKYLTIGQDQNDATSPSLSRAILKNAQFSGSWTNEAPTAPCRVGYSYGSGTLTVDGDSIFGYAPRVGENSRGAVYQLDGLVAYTNATWAGHMWLAPASYCWGYYALEGGKLDAQGSITMASGTAACGILHQTGGEMVCRSLRNTTSLYGYGLVRHSGGTANYTSSYYAPKSDSGSKNLESALVVDGGNVTIASLYLLNGTANDDAHVVLNGGRLAMPTFNITSMLSGGIAYGLMGENNRAYLSFDGGEYAPMFGGYTSISFVNLANAFTRATVYSGGAVLDVAEGHELYLNQNLKAPEGRGIAAVAWQGFPGVADDAFLGPPGVRILGDGEGAVAVAVYDRASGRVTGIEVLAPGVNYTWAKAEILYAAGSMRVGAVTNDCTLTAETPAAGFLVKRGEGTLRIISTNSVAGVSLEGGLVRVAAPDALPSPCTIAFKGGRIETMNGATLPPVNLRLTVGETATYPAAFTFPAGSTMSIEGLENVRKEDHGYTLASFPAGVENLPPLVDELPAKWQLSRSGTALRLSYVKGVTIIFR